MSAEQTADHGIGIRRLAHGLGLVTRPDQPDAGRSRLHPGEPLRIGADDDHLARRLPAGPVRERDRRIP